jgi:hypothetical protein
MRLPFSLRLPLLSLSLAASVFLPVVTAQSPDFAQHRWSEPSDRGLFVTRPVNYLEQPPRNSDDLTAPVPVPPDLIDTADELASDNIDEIANAVTARGALEPNTATLTNNFTADPKFNSGIVITHQDVAMKIGGYVKADLIYDLDPIASTDSFDTTTILIGAAPYRNVRFHARQSRLSFDTRWQVNGDVARAFIEADFFGGGSSGSSDFRLRHAYGQLKQFTAGQTWTTFTDPSAVPQTLDFEGAVSNVNRRQGLVRWEQPLWDDRFSVGVGIEDPSINIEGSEMVAGDGRTESPDFITRVRYDPDFGEYQAALVVRKLGFQPVGESVITQNAWGFNFTGSLLLLDTSKFYYQVTFGEGIGSYRGSPDVVVTGPNTGEVLPMFGWMLGVHHEWTDQLTSNFTFSKLSLENIPGQSPDNLRETTYLAVNLIANPYERVFCGVEYLYGIRDNAGGASADAHRLQMSFGFYLP